MSVASGGIQITPKRLQAQWQNATHKFQVNVWNFEVEAGKAATHVFKRSFDMKKLNTSGGAPWPRRSKYSKASHPLMVETQSLKRSIKWKRFAYGPGVTIYTDPSAFMNTSRHKGFCYAAVHNGPSSFRTGRVKNMPRRQFIGHSTVLEDELRKLSVMIFNGFPK